METVFLGKGHWQKTYAVHFRPGCLSTLPFGRDCFECTIIPCNDTTVLQMGEDIAREIVAANTDWVHTTGVHAEWLHDLIDQTSVMVGRQVKVGDGSPMTAWFSNSKTIEQKVGAVFNSFSGCMQAVAVIVGDEQDFQKVVSALSDKLSQINREYEELTKEEGNT